MLVVRLTNTRADANVATMSDPSRDPAQLRSISGWGRIGVLGEEAFSEDLEALTKGAVLSRGLGRSYGDSALPPADEPRVATTTRANRILGFDPASLVLSGQAGVSIEQLNRELLPRGVFVPVTPGTQFVTLGGAVAADVHGKNHHVAGCFGSHVRRLRMRLASGDIVTATPDGPERDLFWATVGGMGLFGHILEVDVAMQRVPSSWIRQRTDRVDDIDQFIDVLKERAETHPYTVGWIDCLSSGRSLGRGTMISGDWAQPREAPTHRAEPMAAFTFPFELPDWALSRASVRAFNALNHWRHLPRTIERVVHWESFFYPLDRIREWNRMYGRRGFTQYQCVLPEAAGRGAARRLLELLSARGGASFLCVIKDCGEAGRGLLSFPMRGISVALDIARRDDTESLVDSLNELVLAEGGRIYLAKDQFTRPEHFRAMEGARFDRFIEARDRWDPDRRIRSAQSVRLFGDRARGSVPVRDVA